MRTRIQPLEHSHSKILQRIRIKYGNFHQLTFRSCGCSRAGNLRLRMLYLTSQLETHRRWHKILGNCGFGNAHEHRCFVEFTWFTVYVDQCQSLCCLAMCLFLGNIMPISLLTLVSTAISTWCHIDSIALQRDPTSVLISWLME